MIREPAAAGTFYDGSKSSLLRSLECCFLGEFGPGKLPAASESRVGNVVGLVCPHAGYVYSGGAAAFVYDALASDGAPDTAVLLGPNHHGLGPAVAISSDAPWQTPLGTVQVDVETANSIVQSSEFAQRSDLAHLREHSIEVQLPFLQYVGGDRTGIVPISIAHLNQRDAQALAIDLGAAISRALMDKSAIVIASTDFTHYESKATAQAQDTIAMGEILKLDGAGLIREVYERSISMCGVIGTSVMIEACKALGAAKARQLTYYTSGDVIGDMTQVVGYGALSIER
jgi:AmmeMemoRadiSam system protein B